MKKRVWIMILIPLVLIIYFAFTFIPHKVVNIEPTDVSKITIFDGNTGYEVEITNDKDIKHIIENLNEVTFQKGKPSFGYMGYSFKVRIFDQKEKRIKELTINAEDKIRYKGFFYTAIDNLIDYQYIEKIVENSDVD